jgi:hypothetical protein
VENTLEPSVKIFLSLLEMSNIMSIFNKYLVKILPDFKDELIFVIKWVGVGWWYFSTCQFVIVICFLGNFVLFFKQ